MTEEESDTIREITRLIYNRLLGQLGPLDQVVRGFEIMGEPDEAPGEVMRDFKTDAELDKERSIDTALSLADRVDTMITAAEAAKARGSQAELRFWHRLIVAGQQESHLIAPPY